MQILGRLIRLTIAAFVLVSCSNQRPPFSGDGVLTDAGLTSYPRYQIAFPPISLKPGHETVLKFKGVPEATMWLGLIVMDSRTGSAAGTRVPEAGRGTCVIGVKLLRKPGEPLAEVKAALEDWKVDQSPRRTMLWHPQLRDLAFDSRHSYELVINVSGPEPSAPLTLRPMLQGGGNELP